MTSAIAADDLVKDYRDVRALDGLSLTVNDGEFFGLLGPNGAGKTTFINILVGLVRKSSGNATVYGYDVETEYREVRNRIGLAPQEYNVDRFFPIEEVLIHKAGYHGIPQREAKRRAEEILELVGILDKRETRFHWLSGGMKRRFMLARAMVTDPNLLILDEPTAGVDVQLRYDLWDIINQLNDAGTTILLTTHYIEEAERLCDRVAIIQNGRNITVDTPSELMDRGSDTIEITLSSIPASSLAFSDNAIVDVQIEGRTVKVRVDRGGFVLPSVIAEIQSKGLEIVDIDLTPTTLEEIFVDLIGETTESSEGVA